MTAHTTPPIANEMTHAQHTGAAITIANDREKKTFISVHFFLYVSFYLFTRRSSSRTITISKDQKKVISAHHPRGVVSGMSFVSEMEYIERHCMSEGKSERTDSLSQETVGMVGNTSLPVVLLLFIPHCRGVMMSFKIIYN